MYLIKMENSSEGISQIENGVIVYGTSFEVGPNYQVISPIGQGAYGIVVAARVKSINSVPDLKDDIDETLDSTDLICDEHEMVAIKKILLKGFTAGMIRRTLREIKILRLLQHENCLTLLLILPPPPR